MFLVRDSQEQRFARIRFFLASDPPIAVLLAVVNLEWTLKRASLFLSEQPTVSVKKRLKGVYKLDAYVDEWRHNVARRPKEHLPQLIPGWGKVREAFELRNELVHGMGGCGTKFATVQVEILLRAAEAVTQHASSRGSNVFSRLPARRRKSV